MSKPVAVSHCAFRCKRRRREKHSGVGCRRTLGLDQARPSGMPLAWVSATPLFAFAGIDWNEGTGISSRQHGQTLHLVLGLQGLIVRWHMGASGQLFLRSSCVCGVGGFQACRHRPRRPVSVWQRCGEWIPLHLHTLCMFTRHILAYESLGRCLPRRNRAFNMLGRIAQKCPARIIFNSTRTEFGNMWPWYLPFSTDMPMSETEQCLLHKSLQQELSITHLSRPLAPDVPRLLALVQTKWPIFVVVARGRELATSCHCVWEVLA